MLMRASSLPSVAVAASPALFLALRLTFIPSLDLSSSSILLNRSARSLLCTTHLPNSSISVSRHAYSVPAMMGQYRPSIKGRAAFTTGSNSVEDREILVQHLLVKEDDLNLLLELQKRVTEGEDLGDLAVEYSLCPSKQEGGMLGWVRKGQMVPEFEEAAFAAPLNKVVRCKTKFGWHLLQVLSEREELRLREIHPDELHMKLQDPSFLEESQLIDVREPEEVAQASLPGFQVLPLRQFGNWGPEVTTKFDPEKETYVMCHHGMRSMQVAQWLKTQGFKRVFNVAGGIHAYAVKADPSIPTY